MWDGRCPRAVIATLTPFFLIGVRGSNHVLHRARPQPIGVMGYICIAQPGLIGVRGYIGEKKMTPPIWQIFDSFNRL